MSFYKGSPTFPLIFTKTILDDHTPSQLHIDFRTRRPTGIDFSSPAADQRAACTTLNRERTRAILEATQLTPPRESLSPDAWLAAVTRASRALEVPLISLEGLGFHHDEDGMLCSQFLSPMTSGAEASPFLDEPWNVVYKLFDLRADGSLGKKICLDQLESDRFEVKLLPAVLVDTLEKLSVLNEAGGHPTEIVGLSANGDYLIAKQPLAFPYKDYQKDREIATKAVGGIVPLFTNLQRQVAVIWLNSNGWLISDLHHRNIMRDREGNPTIIDALIGPVPPSAQRQLAWLRNAVEDAEDVRRGGPPRKRVQFGDDTDDDSL
jgi:hypothetical protein